MIRMMHGNPIDINKNNETYARQRQAAGNKATVVDFVDTKFYYGREFCTDGTVVPWMRPVENSIINDEVEWDKAANKWRLVEK